MPPYSPSCSIDDKYVFISGQVALDPNATEILISRRWRRIEKATQSNQKCQSSLLKKSGASWDSALFVQIFLTDISNYGALNAAYEEALRDCEKPPARACFAVKRLPRGALVEIECIALKQEGKNITRDTLPGNKLFQQIGDD